MLTRPALSNFKASNRLLQLYYFTTKVNFMNILFCFQLAVVRQVLRKEIGMKIVEVDTEKATVEGSDVLWTGVTLALMQIY